MIFQIILHISNIIHLSINYSLNIKVDIVFTVSSTLLRAIFWNVAPLDV